jgi:hypothetical protein
MLHFIFNPFHVCVLISYDLLKGEFVLQIPFFKNVEKEYSKEECLGVISSLLTENKSAKIDDIVSYF